MSKKALGLILLAGMFCASAQAHHDEGPPSYNDHPGWTSGPDHNRKNLTIVAPEIDPATAISGLTLLAGGLAVIRGRRKKK